MAQQFGFTGMPTFPTMPFPGAQQQQTAAAGATSPRGGRGSRWSGETIANLQKKNRYMKVTRDPTTGRFKTVNVTLSGARGGGKAGAGLGNWRQDAGFVFLPDLRLAGDAQTLRQFLSQFESIRQAEGQYPGYVEQMLARAYTQANTEVGGARRGQYEGEINQYRQTRGEAKKKGTQDAGGIRLEHLPSIREYLTTGRVGAQTAKGPSKRGGRGNILDRLRALGQDRYFDVTGAEPTGTGIASKQRSKLKDQGMQTQLGWYLPIASRTRRGYLNAVQQLRPYEAEISQMYRWPQGMSLDYLTNLYAQQFGEGPGALPVASGMLAQTGQQFPIQQQQFPVQQQFQQQFQQQIPVPDLTAGSPRGQASPIGFSQAGIQLPGQNTQFGGIQLPGGSPRQFGGIQLPGGSPLATGSLSPRTGLTLPPLPMGTASPAAFGGIQLPGTISPGQTGGILLPGQLTGLPSARSPRSSQ